MQSLVIKNRLFKYILIDLFYYLMFMRLSC